MQFSYTDQEQLGRYFSHEPEYAAAGCCAAEVTLNISHANYILHLTKLSDILRVMTQFATERSEYAYVTAIGLLIRTEITLMHDYLAYTST